MGFDPKNEKPSAAAFSSNRSAKLNSSCDKIGGYKPDSFQSHRPARAPQAP